MYSGPYFMIDIETTGIDPMNNQVLEIGLVEVNRINGLWSPGRYFHTYQHTTLEPKSEFSLKFQKDLYAQCQITEPKETFLIRRAILDFVKACGITPGPDLKFMGWNAAIFDIPFLCHYGYLDATHHEMVDGKDVRRGDFDYHVYDVCSVLCFMADSIGVEIKELKKTIDTFKMPLPCPDEIGVSGRHTAIYDCIKQIEFLNGLLFLSRKR